MTTSNQKAKAKLNQKTHAIPSKPLLPQEPRDGISRLLAQSAKREDVIIWKQQDYEIGNFPGKLKH
jgi:hypothetical protein